MNSDKGLLLTNEIKNIMATVKINAPITTAAYSGDYEYTPEYGLDIDASIHFEDDNEKSIQVCIDGYHYFPEQLESLLKYVERAKQIIALNKETQVVSQSHGLTGFYREYKSWIKSANNEHIIFEPGYDLNSNLRNYCYYGHPSDVGLSRYNKLSAELKEQLKSEGLDPDKPFGEVYPWMHFNSKLIKWVNEHAH